MPRARTTESDDVVVVKKPRAPRARAVSADGETTPAPRKRAPRKTAPKAVAAPEPSREPAPVSVTAQRKAPTPIAAERRTKVRHNKMLAVTATICFMIMGAGVTVGLFDHGAIDVVAVVNSRNEQISRGEVRDENGQTVTSAVPVQADNSGLRVSEPTTPAAPPATTAPVETASTTPAAETAGSSTATTTSATASSSSPL